MWALSARVWHPYRNAWPLILDTSTIIKCVCTSAMFGLCKTLQLSTVAGFYWVQIKWHEKKKKKLDPHDSRHILKAITHKLDTGEILVSNKKIIRETVCYSAFMQWHLSSNGTLHLQSSELFASSIQDYISVLKCPVSVRFCHSLCHSNPKHAFFHLVWSSDTPVLGLLPNKTLLPPSMCGNAANTGINAACRLFTFMILIVMATLAVACIIFWWLLLYKRCHERWYAPTLIALAFVAVVISKDNSVKLRSR